MPLMKYFGFVGSTLVLLPFFYELACAPTRR